jgi:hypothetical protein
MFAYQTESPAQFSVDSPPGMNVFIAWIGAIELAGSYASSLYDLAGYGDGGDAAL